MENNYIIVADDDRVNRDLVVEIVRTYFGEQLKFLPAQNASEALDLLEAYPKKVCLLVTDNNMPGMLGLDLIKQIKIQYPAIPAILMSGLPIEIHTADRFFFKTEIFSKLPVFVSELLALKPTPP